MLLLAISSRIDVGYGNQYPEMITRDHNTGFMRSGYLNASDTKAPLPLGSIYISSGVY